MSEGERGEGNTGERPAGGTPAVGNILGFSLLFRDRRALLALPRRGLAPGVKLRDYEAEIPGVQFPLKGPLSATAFRGRRCKAQQATLSIEARGLRRYVAARLVSKQIRGLRIVAVDLELRAALPETPGHRPLLRIEARRNDGESAWLMVGVRVEPEGRKVRLSPSHLWLIGRAPQGDSAAELWQAIARRIVGHKAELNRQDASVLVDPARQTLTHAFVGAGWKSPDLAGLAVETLSLSRRAVTLELRAGDDAQGINVQAAAPERDTVSQALERASAQLSAGELEPALERLAQVSDLLVDLPEARLALVKWRVQLSRWRAPELAREALREWLDLRPSAHEARRMLAVQLARAHDAPALAKLLAADCRSPHPPVTQARLELALATLLVTDLHESRAAIALVGPLVARLRGAGQMPPELLPNALVCLAQARAAEAGRGHGLAHAPHALEALDEALGLVDEGPRRSDMRARLARTFSEHGADTQALRLLMAALQEDAQSLELIDDAAELALKVGEFDVTAELLRVRVGLSEQREREAQRERLADVLMRIDSNASRAEALDLLRSILDFDPENPGLLRKAARLEQLSGDTEAAAEHLGRLLDDPQLEPQERAQLALDRALLLRKIGELDEAWEALRPALPLPPRAGGTAGEREYEGQPLNPLELRVLELALELAPPTDRDRLLDRLIEGASGPARGRALLDRAAQSFDPVQRVADLWAACEVLEDRDEVRASLESMLGHDDSEGLERLALMAEQDADPGMAGRAWTRMARYFATRGEGAQPSDHGAADAELAVAALERAQRHGRLAPELHQLLARQLRAVDRRADALNVYREVLEQRLALEAQDPPASIPKGAGLEALAFEAVDLAEAMREPESVVQLLARYEEYFGDEGAQRAAHQHFTALVELGDEAAARTFVYGQLEDPRNAQEPARRAQWLKRAAALTEGREQLQLLKAAHEAAPQDTDLDARYRARLAEHGDPQERTDDLLSRFEGAEPAQRLALLVELLEIDRAHGTAQDETRLSWHEARLELDPESTESLLAAATLHRAAGHHDAALDRFRRAELRLAPDDPRRLEPARALASAAIGAGEFELARAHLLSALEFDPEDAETIDALDKAATVLDDPRSKLVALDARRALLGDEDVALTLERARALVAQSETEQAFAALATACERVEQRSVLHLELAEFWLELGREQRVTREQWLALAQMRFALGPDLPVDELVREINLGREMPESEAAAAAAGEQGPWRAARDLLARSLVRRQAPPALLGAIPGFLNDQAAESLAAFDASLAALEDSEGAPRLAQTLAPLCKAHDEAALCLRALERLADGGRHDPGLAQLRDWAVLELGVEQGELDGLRAQLARPPLEPVALERFLRLCPRDATFGELVALAEQAEDAHALAIVQATFGLELARSPHQQLSALEIFSRSGDAEAMHEHWLSALESMQAQPAVLEALLPRLLHMGLRAQDPALQARASVHLHGALQHEPTSAPLMRELWVAATAVNQDAEPASSPANESLFATTLEALLRRSELHVAQTLLATALAQIDVERADPWLGNLAQQLADDRDRLALPLALLASRRAWPELCVRLGLDLEGPPAADAARWRDLGDHAQHDADEAAELIARRNAVEAFAEAELKSELVDQAQRLLIIDPSLAQLRWRMAQAMAQLDRNEEARDAYLVLYDDKAWSEAGVELGVLARKAGLAATHSLDERAAELLLVARRREDEDAAQPPGTDPELEEALYATFERLGRGEEAKRLALENVERAAPPGLGTPEDSEPTSFEGSDLERWLVRAYNHALGSERLELVRRRLKFTPDDVALVREAETLAQELGDVETVHQQIRRRIELEPELAPKLLRRLLADQQTTASDSHTENLVRLREELLTHEPRNLELLLDQAMALQAREQLEARDALWIRALEVAHSDDPRMLGPARTLAAAVLRRDHDADALASAEAHAARALALAPDDRDLLQLRVDLARARNDQRAELERLERLHEFTRDPGIRADLAERMANCADGVGDVPRAQEAFSLAYLEALDSDAEPDAVRARLERWREWTRGLSDARSPRFELEALRANAAQAPETRTDAEVQREVELLTALEEFDDAHRLCEAQLLAQPTSTAWGQRLRECLQQIPPQARLLSMRRVVDTVQEISARDAWAMELAGEARRHEAARTALAALDALSPDAARRTELLEIREWAVRELGEVDDELQRLEDRLSAHPEDDDAANRIARMLEHDHLACAKRFAALADQASEPAALRNRALHNVVLADLRGLDFAVVQLQAAASEGNPANEAWERSLALALERVDVEALVGLAEACARATDAGEGKKPWAGRALPMLADALSLAPGEEGLHRALPAALAPHDGVDARRRWFENLADAHELDDRALALLFVTAARLLDRPAPFLVGAARQHIDRPRVVDAIEDELSDREAWSARLELFHARKEGDPQRWATLAEQAAGAPSVQLAALRRTASISMDNGDAAAAARAYARAVSLAPDEPELRVAEVHALDALDNPRRALEAWRQLLVDGHAPDPLAASRRAAALAGQVQDNPQERAMLELAFTHAAANGQIHAHREVAEALFAAHERGEARAAMAALAQAMTGAQMADAERLPWHIRAAELSEDQARVEHLRAALELSVRAGSQLPEGVISEQEVQIADQLEAQLREDQDLSVLRDFLRERAELAQRRGAPASDQGAAWTKLANTFEDIPEAQGPRESYALALQGQLRDSPADIELRLALGQLREFEGDDEAAAHHFRTAIARLEAEDPRVKLPSRLLARVAQNHGELDKAIEHLERARALEPDHAQTLLELGELARVAGRPGLLAEVMQARLVEASIESYPALLSDRVDALLLDGDEDSALLAAREGAQHEDLPKEARQAFGQRWIELALHIAAGSPTLAEAESRAYWRVSLASPLSDESRLAELRLAMLMQRPIHAAQLALEGLVGAPSSAQYFQSLERAWDFASPQGGTQVEATAASSQWAASLSEVGVPISAETQLVQLRQVLTAQLGGTSVAADEAQAGLGAALLRRGGARLIELSVDANDPQACLLGLEALGDDEAASPQMLEHREWALRELGQVEEELASLGELLRSAPSSVTLTRIHRLLVDVDASFELVKGAATEPDLNFERQCDLADLTVDFARRHAPSRLDLAIAGVRLFIAQERFSELDQQLPALETLAESQGSAEALHGLLDLVAEHGQHPAFEPHRQAILVHALCLDPDATEIHVTMRAVEVSPDSELVRRGVLAAAAERLGQHSAQLGDAIVAMHTSARLSDEAQALALLGDAREHRDSDAGLVLLAALEAHHHHAALFDYWTEDGGAQTRVLTALTKLAAQAQVQAPHIHASALRFIALVQREHEDPSLAAAALHAALEASPGDLWLSYSLGEALERGGRAEAALEHFLPFTSGPDEGAREPAPYFLDFGSPGPEHDHTDDAGQAKGAQRPAPVLVFDHLVRCARLLRASQQLPRAAEYYARAHAHALAFEANPQWLPADAPVQVDAQLAQISEPYYALLVELEAHERAAQLSAEQAARAFALHDQDKALQWRRRAAALSQGGDRVRHLRDAIAQAPADDELSAQLCEALRELGDRGALALAIDDRILARTQDGESPQQVKLLAELARERLDLDRQMAQDGGVVSASPELQIRWWRHVLTHDPDDVAAILAVAEAFSAQGNPTASERAVAAWTRAGQLLAREDDRFFAPAHALADHYATRGEVDAARQVLERALAIRPGDVDTLQALRRCAEALGDDALMLRVLSGLLEATQDPTQTSDLEVRSARIHVRAQRYAEGFAAYERAATLPELEPAVATEVLADWLNATRGQLRGLEESQRMRFEAVARHQVRVHAGEALELETLLTESRLLAQGLGRLDEGIDLLDSHLARWPEADPLHTAFHDFAFASRNGLRYADALEKTAESTGDPALADGLRRRRAFVLLELEDAEGVLGTLEALSPQQREDAELLDLRDWALRKAGKLELELNTLDQALLETPNDPSLIERLLRSLDRQPVAAAQRLLALQGERPDDGRLSRAALEQLRSANTGSAAGAVPVDLRVDIARAMLDAGDTQGLRLSWDEVATPIVNAQRPNPIAQLVEIARTLTADGQPLRPGPRWILEQGLALDPEHTDLHEVFWAAFEHEEAANKLLAAEQAMQEFAASSSLDGEDLARLWIAFCRPLDRRERAALLARRSHEQLTSAAVFEPMLGALEQDNHWPEAMSLWEARLEAEPEPAARIAALKHLAHLSANVLGDPSAAIEYLERALVLAPRDPDLLIPLLDHYYARPALDRAIELSKTVLDYVPMGNVAYAALGNRAADAALAHGDHTEAEALLDMVMQRCPNDARTRERRNELGALAQDPEHRTRMLEAIADRQSGSARIEALEERARLLVDPLERLEDAVLVLETVLAEAPMREGAAASLTQLYRDTGRHGELVELLERRFAQATGEDRRDMLREIAAVQRFNLFDLGRAEQALKLALEDMGDAVQPGDELDALVTSLVEVLEQQGRYADMIEQLRAYLAPELAGTRELRDSRVQMAVRLADALREHGDDPSEAAVLYAQLEAAGHLPESGLATLARWFRAESRHEDLIRVLNVRSKRLEELGDRRKKAEVDIRIGELLDGPVRRPHEAADYFLDAYLVDPLEFREAGAKARVLLAGTDSVVNVRTRLLARAKEIEAQTRPALLTLLGDLLAPHEEHESEAETVYKRAIAMDPDLAHAQEGLGRLMARQARLEDAASALVAAATSPHMAPDRAADNAATAARVLLELARADEAEAVLRQALGRAPTAQRALLELARLYEREGRPDDQADVLDELSALPVSSILRAEIAYRRAMLLDEQFKADPLGEAGESARSYLLEAVSSDNMHAQARQVLLELATARSEWSIVAHMYYLAIRELGPGIHKAQTHLDLAEVYLDRLSDHESATRNVTSAVAQAPREMVVTRRASAVAARLPDAGVAAKRVEAVASADQEIEANGRARLWLLAAELWARADDYDASARATQSASELEGLHGDVVQAVRRSEESQRGQDTELRRERAALLRLLDDEEQAAERMHILGRLRELGRALEDQGLVDRADSEQLELAHKLLEQEAPAAPTAALDHLRELFAEHEDYGRVLSVYDELISRTQNDELAAGLWTDAARLTWAGQRDARGAYDRLRRALQRDPGSALALEQMAELLAATEDAEIRAAILNHLTDDGVLARAPRLALRLADTALREEQYERAEKLLTGLTQAQLEPELKMQAMNALDSSYEARGMHAERLPNLARRAELARDAVPAMVGHAALTLASVQRALGAFDEARKTCADGLVSQPSHVALTRMYVDLLDLAQDWPTLARSLEQLAALTIEPEERAGWLTRAARVHLAHGVDREVATERARGLLLEACETSRRSLDPRAELVPLAFSEGRWDEVLEYAIQLRAIAGDDHECLVQAAIAEAFVHGRRTMARAIDRRHDRSERARTLWPSVTEVLDRIARQGPLPRLDAVIGAAAVMCGGTQNVIDEYAAWAAGRTAGPGTHLARARLHEAAGHGDLARNLYQLAAFTAPAGPVVELIRRLPAPELPMDPLREQDWIPLEWRSALREVMIQLRTRISGVRAPTPIEFALPESTTQRATVQSAGRMTAPWRDALGMAIPVRLTNSPLPMHIAVRNEAEPVILLGGDFIHLPEGERVFRLAAASTTIASGLALLDDSYAGVLNDLIDALVALVNPRHVPGSEGARTIVESLAAAGMTGAQLPTPLRDRLAQELAHWFAKVPQLEHVIRRSRLLLATHLCGRLDGALMAMARDRGLIVEGEIPDGTTVLETDDARWLLLSLGVFGTGFDPAAGQAY